MIDSFLFKRKKGNGAQFAVLISSTSEGKREREDNLVEWGNMGRLGSEERESGRLMEDQGKEIG